MLNQMFERNEKFTAARGVQLKMALSQLEDWVAGCGLQACVQREAASAPLLAHVTQAANVFLVDKNVSHLYECYVACGICNCSRRSRAAT